MARLGSCHDVRAPWLEDVTFIPAALACQQAGAWQARCTIKGIKHRRLYHLPSANDTAGRDGNIATNAAARTGARCRLRRQQELCSTSEVSTCHALDFAQDARRVHFEPAEAQWPNVFRHIPCALLRAESTCLFPKPKLVCSPGSLTFVFHVRCRGEDYAFAFLRSLRSLWRPDGESRIADGPEVGFQNRLRMQAEGSHFSMMPGASARTRHCSGLEACTCAPPSLKMPTYVSLQRSLELCCRRKVTTQDFVETLRQRAPVGTALSIVSRHSRSSEFLLVTCA